MGWCCLRLLITLLDESDERWIQEPGVRTSEHSPAGEQPIAAKITSGSGPHERCFETGQPICMSRRSHCRQLQWPSRPVEC